jgi:hypothetical protein
MVLHLTVEGHGELEFDVKKILNAGYTGRDQREVQRHIDELKKKGIAAPRSIPEFFPKLSDRITNAGRIEVLSEDTTSGEAEFVLLFSRDGLYVGVGSDHTDRRIEQYSDLASKQMCPNVLSSTVWRYEEVETHWDDLILRSWVDRHGERQLYQDAKLEAFMPVELLIEEIRKATRGDDTNGLVFYSGTIPTVDGEMCFSPYFETVLIDRRLERSIRCYYAVEPIAWFTGEIRTAAHTGGDEMAKPEMEIQDIEHIPWQPVVGAGVSGSGIYERILSKDPKTGNYTRLLKVEPGVETAELLSHDVWEEIWVVEGKMIDKGKNLVLTKGMYGCRPPGMKHGPYSYPEGVVCLEWRYRAQ